MALHQCSSFLDLCELLSLLSSKAQFTLIRTGMQMLKDAAQPELGSLALTVLLHWPAAGQDSTMLQSCRSCQSRCCQMALAAVHAGDGPAAARWLGTTVRAQRLLSHAGGQTRPQVGSHLLPVLLCPLNLCQALHCIDDRSTGECHDPATLYELPSCMAASSACH